MKTALIVTGKMAQDHEFIYPYYRLQEAGFDIIVAVKGGDATTGFLGSKIPPDQNNRVVMLSCLPEYLDADLLVLPGGAKCMEYLRQEKEVISFIREFDLKGGIIASICHAAQLLISAKVVSGRKISGYYSIKDDIVNAGAEYVDAPYVVDRNIVSCPHYKHLGPWMKKVLEVVGE